METQTEKQTSKVVILALELALRPLDGFVHISK